MRIRDYKFKRESDFKIFKALLRVAKEDRVAYKRLIERFGSFKEMASTCYASRTGHPSEGIQTNASYWANDCGLAFFEVSRLIYMALLITSLRSKPEPCVINRFVSCYKDICYNNGHLSAYKGDLISYYDNIRNAFMRCGLKQKAAEEKIFVLDSLLKAAKYNLPL